MLDDLRRSAVNRVGFPGLAVDLQGFLMDAALGVGRHAAPGGGGLFTGRSHRDESQRRQRPRGGPQTGRIDAVVVGQQDESLLAYSASPQRSHDGGSYQPDGEKKSRPVRAALS